MNEASFVVCLALLVKSRWQVIGKHGALNIASSLFSAFVIFVAVTH